MANAGAVPPCGFRWEITEPFLRYTAQYARFYAGYPTPRQWRVTLVPGTIYLKEWRFRLNLVCKEGGEEFLTDRVKIYIFLDGREVLYRNERGYCFREENHHTYNLQVVAIVHPREQAHQLNIGIEMAFSASAAELRPGHGLFYNPEDLALLSDSMKNLLSSAYFSDIELQSKDPTSDIKAHCCILEARWKVFLREKRIISPPNTAVETLISRSILRYVLHYMYSGELGENLDLNDLATRAELFQVIDRYRIHHLYRLFVRSESRQVRKTVTNVTRCLESFPLGVDIAARVNTPSYTWPVRNGPNRLVFCIRFSMKKRNPSFRYSFNMTSGSWDHVRTNLELVKMVKVPERGLTECASWDVHESDHVISPRTVTESDLCRFEDYAVPMDEVRRGRFMSQGREYRFFVRCTLSFTDGDSSLVEVSEGNDQRPTHLERLEVLSDHLYLLLRSRTRADMIALCPDSDDHYLHRAILAARVPEWTQVLWILYAAKNRIYQKPQQTVVRTEVPDQAFQYILEYMYTGKTFRILDHDLYEIEHFANVGKFFPLLDKVLQRRRV